MIFQSRVVSVPTSIRRTGRFVTKKKISLKKIKLNEEADEVHLNEMMDGSVLSLNVSVHIDRTHKPPHAQHIVLDCSDTYNRNTYKKHLKLDAPNDVPVYSPEETF